MSISRIRRGAVRARVGTPNANDIRVDSTSDVLVFGTGTSGTTEKTVVDTTSTQTLTNKTLTSPTINGSTIGGVSTLTGNINADTTFCTTQFDAVTGTTGATLTNVVGLSQTVVAGTYVFVCRIHGVATSNSGIKLGFKYTTAALTSLESMARIFTASAVAVQHTTSTTDQASLAASTTAAIFTEISGRMVVSTGGTVQLQAAQNAAHTDTTSVYVGASMTFTRTA